MNFKLSIITISFNTYQDLKNTFNSVFSQSCQNFEYVVIDGNSNDDTQYLLALEKYRINKLIIERDSGIFNAMNKGIKNSSGEFLLFLNAGDTLYDEKVVEKLLNILKNDQYDLICGDYVTNKIIYKAKRPGYDFLDMPTCHQSILFKRDNDLLFYDERLKLFSDIDLFARYYKNNKIIGYIDLIISEYKGGGISTKRSFHSFQSRIFLIYKHKGILGLLKYIFKRVKDQFVLSN